MLALRPSPPPLTDEQNERVSPRPRKQNVRAGGEFLYNFPYPRAPGHHPREKGEPIIHERNHLHRRVPAVG